MQSTRCCSLRSDRIARAPSALAHTLESEGVATTQISLVREHTAAIHPPRALWVPFILGRPLGVPGDAAFQGRVLAAALGLLEAAAGPVLVDYDEEAPALDEESTEGVVACPVAFGREADPNDLGGALEREIESLAPWHDLAVKRRGRTTTGLSGVDRAQAARILTMYLQGSPPRNFKQLSAGETLKIVCDDIRAYYYEAAGAQPGMPDAQAIEHWFWHETAAARAFLALQKLCIASDDVSMQVFGGNTLVPRAIQHTLHG